MQPYYQTTSFTTASSSLLTILHYLNPEISFNREKEFDIWKKTVNLPTRASSIFALAIYAKNEGFPPIVIVENKGYSFPDYRFYRYTKKDIEEAAYSSSLHLKEAEKEEISIKEMDLSLKYIKEQLEKGKIFLLRINAKPIRSVKRNSSNYIVVHGFKGGFFNIVDPAFGALSIPEDVMKESFESLETKKFRDHRALIFSTK